jgi:Na+/melibiose symporter-like transporter
MQTSNTPLILGFSCFGYILGEVRTIVNFINQKPSDITDIIMLMIVMLLFGMGFALTIWGFKEKKQIKKILQEIQSRQSIQFVPAQAPIYYPVKKNSSKKQSLPL